MGFAVTDDGMRRRRGLALGWVAVAICMGLGWRLLPLPLSPFAWKYGGTGWYGVMLYWLVASVCPRTRTGVVAAWALLLAFAVETSKLVHWAALDAFRTTLAGKLLLGRVFGVGALLAYAVVIGAMAVADRYQRTRRRRLE